MERRKQVKAAQMPPVCVNFPPADRSLSLYRDAEVFSEMSKRDRLPLLSDTWVACAPWMLRLRTGARVMLHE